MVFDTDEGVRSKEESQFDTVEPSLRKSSSPPDDTMEPSLHKSSSPLGAQSQTASGTWSQGVQGPCGYRCFAEKEI